MYALVNAILLFLISFHLYGAEQPIVSCIQQVAVDKNVNLKTLYSEKIQMKTGKGKVRVRSDQNKTLVPYYNGEKITQSVFGEEFPIQVHGGRWDANDECICWAPGNVWEKTRKLFTFFFNENVKSEFTFLDDIRHVNLSKIHKNMLYVFLENRDLFSNDTQIILELVNTKTNETLKKFNMVVNSAPGTWRIVESAFPDSYILYSTTSWMNDNWLFDFNAFKPIKKTPISHIRKCAINNNGEKIAVFTKSFDSSKIIICSSNALETQLFVHDLNNWHVNSLFFYDEQYVYYSANTLCDTCKKSHMLQTVSRIDLTTNTSQEMFSSRDDILKCYLLSKSTAHREIAIRKNEFGPWSILSVDQIEANIKSNNN